MTRLLPCSRNVPRECRRIRCRAAAVWHPPFSPPQSLVWRPARRVDVRQFHRVIPPKCAARPTSQPPACAVTYFYATQICEIHSASNIVSIYPPRAAPPAPAEGGRGEIRCLTAIHWRSPAPPPAETTSPAEASSNFALSAPPDAPRPA